MNKIKNKNNKKTNTKKKCTKNIFMKVTKKELK